jgi:transposase
LVDDGIVTRRQGYVFELRLNNREATTLRRFAGCCRFVWNELLAMNELRHERGEPSRTCPECGHVAAENRTTQERFLCVNCGRTENADVNAAINIRERGLELVQGGATPGVPVEGAKRSAKQETRCGYAA